jgi:hypothetical protein
MNSLLLKSFHQLLFQGHPFASLFNCIRLENITEGKGVYPFACRPLNYLNPFALAAHLDEMERMNILPVSRMLQLFKLHHLVVCILVLIGFRLLMCNLVNDQF